jgi:very-short-patch-repair endonuclease
MNGHWCPFCSNQRLCENNNCNLCYNKSFASHEKSKYWNYIKNINKKDEKIKPRNVFKSSTSKKYWFKCNICNEDFNIKLGSIVSQNSWCPICVNKTEKKLHHWITERKNEFNYIHYQTQYKPEWADLRKTHNTRYIYDFYLEFYDVKIIIELDGRQHYKQVSNWSTPLHNQIRDKIKENLATNQDINIIRLNQEDVFNDKGNWEKELLQSIHSIRENSDKITMIYDLTDSKRYIVK